MTAADLDQMLSCVQVKHIYISQTGYGFVGQVVRRYTGGWGTDLRGGKHHTFMSAL